MANSYVLIDFENTPVKSLELLKDKGCHIIRTQAGRRR
jgi:hypothetical protein